MMILFKALATTALLAVGYYTFAQTEIKYLSGTGADHTVPWDFYCTDGINSKKWSKINVPSCWEQQGFGEYNYGHVPLDKRLNEQGHYKHEFIAPQGWKGKDIQIIFEGVFTDCEIMLNNQPVGRHQGGFYEFGFDLTDQISYGQKNLLEVKVKKKSDNISVNQAELEADFWNFGGIFRPVYIQVNPKEHIEHVAIDPRADGTIRADITIKNSEKSARLQLTIKDFKGKTLATFIEPVKKGTGTFRSTKQFANPKLWSPEFPNRYIAEYAILDKDGKLLHTRRVKIGFRTVEVRAQDGIYVNGARVKFKGVNAHTFHPDFGRTSSERMSIETVNLIKDMNMNAVRLSHYPHDKHFMNACDSLGLFVLDELTGWQAPSYDSVIGRKLLRELVKRDVNYASVLFWDNGNEGGWNKAYDHEFAEVDIQQREVLHPWGAFGKTVTSHYIDYNYLSGDNFANRQIFLPTEFLHGLYDGGLGAGLNDYWSKMWANPLCAGGFLWVLADEMVNRTDTKVLDGDGNHAPDGIVGPYHEKEGSYYTIKEIWSPIFIEDKYITAAFDGMLNIENRFHYTNLTDCKLSYRWVLCPTTSADSRRIISQGPVPVSPLKPMERTRVKVAMPATWRQADVLEIEAKDPHGRHIYTWTFPVKSPDEVANNRITAMMRQQQAVQYSETNDNFVFDVGTIKIVIDKNSGLLREVANAKGTLPLTNGPVSASEHDKVMSVRHTETGGVHQVAVTYEKNRMNVVWSINPGGLVGLDVKYRPSNNVAFCGIDFDLAESEVAGLKWMGNGPYGVWKNRLKGVSFNVWEKKYNNTVTGSSGFIYPEFKGYHSKLYWAQINLKQGRSFKVYCKSEDVYLKLFNPKPGPDPANTLVKHSRGDLSFLHGIPAIGNKFSKTDVLGPESANYQFEPKRVLDDYLNMSLVFDFAGIE
ncbi:glycoside hydrolase family 2 protein [Niabella sp. 22666]|uniref:glycoside hydrolase family 2 protein n=1 Tax=Niabella sp. 22666 TaxID=3453954 RepID=UPI003F86B29D